MKITSITSSACEIPYRQHDRRRQSGAVLVVGLIFLMVLSLLGVTVMQSGILEERMAGNMRDWNVAFQAAEAALRDAELDVRGGRIAGAAGFVDGMRYRGSVSRPMLAWHYCAGVGIPALSI